MKTLIIIGLIISIFLSSSIAISVKKFEINNLYSLKQLFKSIVDKNFEESLKYFNILVYIKIYVLDIIPLCVLKIDNKFIRKLLLKKRKKDNKIVSKLESKKLKLNNQENNSKNTNNDEANNRTKSKIKIESNIKLKDITINELKINMDIDIKDSYNESIIVSFGNILLSYLYTFLFEKCNMKNAKKCKYIIKPEFKNQNKFYLNIKTEISMNILKTLSKLKMYKLKLNVNNTNKFKVRHYINFRNDCKEHEF